MAELEQVIQIIEQGLVKKLPTEDYTPRKMPLSKRMAHYNVPGFSAAVILGGELAWAKGFGVVEAGGEKAVTPETIFQAASISKPVAAMVALHLVEKGVLDLDADVNDALQTWELKENKYTQTHKVTLRGLLSHTAGINIHGYRGYPQSSELPSLQQVLDGKPPANSKKVRVVQPPGTDFKYSGGGYVLLQLLIEDVTGSTLAELAQELILDKLGMENSTFGHHLPEENIPQAAAGHQKTGELVPGKWHVYPEQAAAGLWSTPTDLARMLIEVYRSANGRSNRVLSLEMTRQMVTPEIGMGGLGFNILQPDGRTVYGHPGWNEGFHGLMITDLDTGDGYVWMDNGENGRLLGREVNRGLAAVYEWLR